MAVQVLSKLEQETSEQLDELAVEGEDTYE